MDFIKLVESIQSNKGISDTDMSKLTGISEYTYYALKKYRIYLSKVAYFSISSVLGLPIEQDSVIEEILSENKQLVGLPESNLSIAAECVNPDYLEKMELELSRLKKTADTIDDKNKVISSQYLEISRLRAELEQGWKDLNQKIQEAYSNGVREGASKFAVMKASENERLLMLINEEYSEKLDKLELALSRVESKYASLYKLVDSYNRLTPQMGIDISSFEKPLSLLKEELGMVVSEETVLQVLLCSEKMKMSFNEILDEVSITSNDLELILKNYQLGKSNNKYIVEKRV